MRRPSPLPNASGWSRSLPTVGWASHGCWIVMATGPKHEKMLPWRSRCIEEWLCFDGYRRRRHLPAEGRMLGRWLCRGRYVGQPRATTPRRTRALIDVSWEPLASVQDPTAPGDARVHDDIPDNLAGRVTLSCGDVASALAAATALRPPAPGEGVAAHRP